MSGPRRMLRNVEPQRGPPIAHATRHLQRPPELTARGSVDAAGLRPRSLAPNAPPAASAGPGRPFRLTVKAIGPWHRRLAWAFGRHFPVNITPTCQARSLGIQSNSHVRLDAAARHLRVRPAHGSRIARMPGMCRYVALATDHERNAAPSRDVHGDWRSHVVRPSRRRYAIPQGRSATAE
jgi:hypothetical protein